jgi:hypothetical protein
MGKIFVLLMSAILLVLLLTGCLEAPTTTVVSTTTIIQTRTVTVTKTVPEVTITKPTQALTTTHVTLTTSTPQQTYLSQTRKEIFDLIHQDNITSAQLDVIRNQFEGKWIEGQGRISNVYSDGHITVEIGPDRWSTNLKLLSTKDITQYQRGQVINFTATIHFTYLILIGYTIDLENGTILSHNP